MQCDPRDTVCPCCGYCRHCGRANAQPAFVPYYPYQPTAVPYYPYPWWGIYPPNGTVTFTAGDFTPVTGVTPGAWTTNNLPPGSLTTT